ncbi:MAG TPA: HDIG domain-containing protein [Methanoregulaceae archaeon]|nr:HDIG domain-containing protein [Methanoregulaceae archaeon]
MPDTIGKYRDLLVSAGCSRKVIAHCEAVTAVAMQYVNSGDGADRELVLAGAMLHDIGRSATHGIGHAQTGAGLCRSLGLPEGVARIVECHTGAGLTADECSLLGLMPIDCVPKTLEEKIVTNADNLVGGGHEISIERDLMESYALKRRSRKRIYRLWLEMEMYRR